MNSGVGVYIHVPFCAGKCPYCDFYSAPFNEELVERYEKALCGEIQKYGARLNKKADSIYFGGGTPGLLGAARIARIIERVRLAFGEKIIETSLELNPSDYKTTDFHLLKKAGVNRLSFGVQSVNEEELRRLGRRHSYDDVVSALSAAGKAGFYDISVDLMLAVPGQNTGSLEKSLDFCIKSGIPHVSAYLLKIEEGTPYFDIRNELSLPGEDEQCELYLFTSEKLRDSGYEHYEISNFCLSGMESVHNLKYWNCEEYVGFGPSAHSFVDGNRFFYPRSLEGFIKAPGVIQDGRGGDPDEYAALRLRLSRGLENREYEKRFGRDIPKEYYGRAERYVREGLAVCDENGIRFTPRGFLASNRLIINVIY